MRLLSFVAVAGVAGVVAAILGGAFGLEVLFAIGATVAALCVAVLACYAVLRQRQVPYPFSDFEVGAEEPAIAPQTAEQELRRKDRGTIPRQL